MGIFGQKPWVNSFAKMTIFRLFELLVFIAYRGISSFQNIIKDLFLAYIAKKKKLQKWPFLDQNQRLTALEKCQFLDFLDFLFLQPRKAFFVQEYHKRHFPGLYCLKKKLKKRPFLDQNHGLTPLEKGQFFDFLDFLFLQPRKAFFRSRI